MIDPRFAVASNCDLDVLARGEDKALRVGGRAGMHQCGTRVAMHDSLPTPRSCTGKQTS
jgi:hypothetical protein